MNPNATFAFMKERTSYHLVPVDHLVLLVKHFTDANKIISCAPQQFQHDGIENENLLPRNYH